MEGNGRILNVPSHYLNNPRPSTEAEESDQDQMETESHTESTTEEQGDEGIGEFDDGKTGKLTLSILLAEDLIHPGEKVLSIDYLGQTFKGDLLPIGKIRSVETGLIFNNPSAWAIYCKKIINPAKKSGCGWASVKYKGRKMDHFKNIWQRRKSQRAADDAKNEAAQILTALSTSGGLGQQQEESPRLLGHSTTPGLIHSSSLNATMSNNKTTFVDLESFAAEGKMQPFTVSVSTSAMLILDLHSHLAMDEVCGYLAGQWDPNSHNLAITHTFPCLTPPNDTSTETAQRVETEIYEELYGKQLTLVGWYHSNPAGPPAPSAKDCFDQLDFQIKLLGNSDASYTPCVGLICAPYMPSAKTCDSSIVVYWAFPPPEGSPQDWGRPMRMSYSAITDPCLSEEVVNSVDKVINFYKKQEKQVPLCSEWREGKYYFEKIGSSLLSKFPQDQDEQLWRYIQAQLLEGTPPPSCWNKERRNSSPEQQTSPQQQRQQQQHPASSSSPSSQQQQQQPPPSHQQQSGLSSSLTIQPAHQQQSTAPPPAHLQQTQIINGRKPSGEEEEIDDDEEEHLKEEQEEIDDDEEQALARRTGTSTEHGLITISQYSPSTGTQMTFTRAPQGGQPVTLSIQETSGPQSYPEPLVLTTNGLRQHSQEEEEGPINFSSSRRREDEGEDSGDEGRLVIKE